MLINVDGAFRYMRIVPAGEGSNVMSQHNGELAAIKTEDYTPGYVSTNSDFNPQTASFFYESGVNAIQSATPSTSLQHVVKVEPGDSSYNMNVVKQVPTAIAPQALQARDQLLAQRQYAQQQAQQQRFFPQPTPGLQQQRNFMIRQEGNLPPHFAVSTNQPRIQYYARPQEQTGVAAHPTNLQYARVQPVVQQQKTQVATTAAVQQVPIMLRPRYPATVQPQFQYGATQVNVRPGAHYSGVDMYPNYGANMKLSTFSQYQAEMPAYGTYPFSVHQQNEVPMHHAQFGYNQAPLEYPLDANDYNDNMGFQGIVKTEPVDGETAVDGGVIKRCKRPRKVKTSDISGEGVDADGVPIRKKRTNKRKKLISGSEGAEPSLADTDVVTAAQPHALTHGELLKQKKKNMAFPKGTFLVRYADLDSDQYAGHIWLVDNHQLLQKYTYDGLDASNLKIFSRTERYSGWLCTRPWLYHPLPDVKSILGNMEKVCVRNHPTRDELLARKEEESRKALILEPEQMDTAEEATNSDVEQLCDEHEGLVKKELAGDISIIKTEVPDVD